MKIIEVPILNEDGSLKYNQVLTPEEVQVLLQFALNFLISAGLSVQVAVKTFQDTEEKEEATPPNTTIN